MDTISQRLNHNLFPVPPLDAHGHLTVFVGGSLIKRNQLDDGKPLIFQVSYHRVSNILKYRIRAGGRNDSQNVQKLLPVLEH
jgi:hypothetical protein